MEELFYLLMMEMQCLAQLKFLMKIYVSLRSRKLVKTVMNQKENKKVDEEESLQEKSMIT